MREEISNNERNAEQRSQSTQRRSAQQGDDYQYSQGGSGSEYRRGSGQGDARQNWEYDNREYNPNRHSQDSWSNSWQQSGRQFEQDGNYNQYGLNNNQGYRSDQVNFSHQPRYQPNEGNRSTGQDSYRGERNSENNQQQAHRFDSDYHQWREEQIKKLDSDYHSWRQERYKKFADEFNEWRDQRSKQASDNKNVSQSSSQHPTNDNVTTNKTK